MLSSRISSAARVVARLGLLCAEAGVLLTRTIAQLERTRFDQKRVHFETISAAPAMRGPVSVAPPPAPIAPPAPPLRRPVVAPLPRSTPRPRPSLDEQRSEIGTASTTTVGTPASMRRSASTTLPGCSDMDGFMAELKRAKLRKTVVEPKRPVRSSGDDVKIVVSTCTGQQVSGCGWLNHGGRPPDEAQPRATAVGGPVRQLGDRSIRFVWSTACRLEQQGLAGLSRASARRLDQQGRVDLSRATTHRFDQQGTAPTDWRRPQPVRAGRFDGVNLEGPSDRPGDHDRLGNTFRGERSSAHRAGRVCSSRRSASRSFAAAATATRADEPAAARPAAQPRRAGPAADQLVALQQAAAHDRAPDPPAPRAEAGPIQAPTGGQLRGRADGEQRHEQGEHGRGDGDGDIGDARRRGRGRRRGRARRTDPHGFGHQARRSEPRRRLWPLAHSSAVPASGQQRAGRAAAGRGRMDRRRLICTWRTCTLLSSMYTL